MSKLKDLIGNGISEVLDSAKGVVTTFIKDRGLEQQINAEIDKRAHEIKLRQMDMAEHDMDVKAADRADARSMYKSSIVSTDKFVRRFPMYLAIVLGGTAVILTLMLMFFPIPDQNRDILNFASGTMWGIVSTVSTFFFGSSYENKHKIDNN